MIVLHLAGRDTGVVVRPTLLLAPPRPPRPHPVIVHAALVVVLVAWASAFVGIRATAPHIGPGPLALGRLVIAVPFLALFISRRPPTEDLRATSSTTRWMVALYGVAWFAAYNVVLNLAGRSIDAGTASMLVNVGPLIVTVVAGTLLHEGYPTPLLAGLAISAGGVVLIGSSSELADGSAVGMALALVAALLYATGVLSQKVALREIDAMCAAWTGSLVGVAVLLPFTPALVRDVGTAPISATVWLCYLGIVPTALGFSLWSFVLRHSTAGRTASATLAVPGLAVAISWAVLGEVPTHRVMIGGAVTLAGVAIGRNPGPVPSLGILSRRAAET